MLVEKTKTNGRFQALVNLEHLRREWEDASDGQSLMDVQTSVGMLLADVVGALELEREEMQQVLGDDLYPEVLPFLKAGQTGGR